MKDITTVEPEDLEVFDKFPELLSLFEEGGDYGFEGCVTRASRDRPYEEIDVAAALIVHNGNVALAARELGRSRRSLHGFVVRNYMLSDLLEDIEAINMDMIESKARQLAIAGDGSLIKYLLGTRAKERGYVQRIENTGKDGSPLNPIVQYQLPDNGRDTKIEAEGNVVSITQMRREGSDREDE